MSNDLSKPPSDLHRAPGAERADRMIVQSQKLVEDAQKVLRQSRRLVESSRRLREAPPKD